MEQLKSLNQGGLFINCFGINILCSVDIFFIHYLWKLYVGLLNMSSNRPFIYTVSSSELRGRVSELEKNLSAQEKEIRSQASKLQELQTQLNQACKELTERDRALAKTSQELSQANDRHQQAVSKVRFYNWYIEMLLIWNILFLFYFCLII